MMVTMRCDHPDIEFILKSLLDMGYGITPASLRLEDITEPIISMLHQSGERSITSRRPSSHRSRSIGCEAGCFRNERS